MIKQVFLKGIRVSFYKGLLFSMVKVCGFTFKSNRMLFGSEQRFKTVTPLSIMFEIRHCLSLSHRLINKTIYN